jgi:hypothetical protein
MKEPPATRRSFLKAAGAVVLTAGSVVRESPSAGAAAFDAFEKNIGELQKAMTVRPEATT